jgi:hypothetical protein
MDFGETLAAMKRGEKVKRLEWHESLVMRLYANTVIAHNDGSVFTPTVGDMYATDWEIPDVNEKQALIDTNIKALGVWVVDPHTKAEQWPRIDLYAELRKTAEQKAAELAETGQAIEDFRFIVKDPRQMFPDQASYAWVIRANGVEYSDYRLFTFNL